MGKKCQVIEVLFPEKIVNEKYLNPIFNDNESVFALRVFLVNL